MSQGRVFIIGAGPGDPALISVRGARLLGQADVVIYDRAAEPALRWARQDAERIAAGAALERDTAQDALSMLLAEKAREGHTVARLKWGDPFVFDSGAKEAMFLHDQGVPFEVVPGITSAAGSASYAGVPLTHPDAGDTMVYLRGQEGDVDETPDVDWAALAALDGTIVCHAGPRLVARILQKLVSHGRSPDDGAALVFRGTRPDQRTVAGTIGELLARATGGEADSDPTGQLIVGNVTRLRDHIRWFDTRPLFGRRIVITRSPERARELADALENLGAETIQAPTFRLTSTEDPESVDRLAAHADDFDWIVFESAGAAARFLTALGAGPRDIRALGRVSICAVGPSTADELAARGLKADVAIAEVGVDAIADALPAHAPLDGRRVLIVRPDHQINGLADALGDRGAVVTDLVAYGTTADPPDSPAAQRIYRELLDGRIDAVTFTSPTAVRRFASLIGEEQAPDLLGTTIVACIGPVTAAAANALGITPTIVGSPMTVPGLVAGLVARFSDTGA